MDQLSQHPSPDDRPRCANFSSSHPGSLFFPETFTFYMYQGKLDDLLWYLYIVLVRDEIFDGITEQGFSGLERRPVNLYKTSSRKIQISGYSEFRVTGRVDVDVEKSGSKLLFQCPVCGATEYSRWNRKFGLALTGSYEEWPDCFMLNQYPGHMIIKQRVADYLMDLKIKPMRLATFVIKE